MSSKQDSDIIVQAISAKANALALYSNFRVGAALEAGQLALELLAFSTNGIEALLVLLNALVDVRPLSRCGGR